MKRKILCTEIALIAAILSITSVKNDNEIKKKEEMSFKTQRVYEELYAEYTNNRKLIGFDTYGKPIIEEEVLCEYTAPKGYKIDYIDKVAYKDIIVPYENEEANLECDSNIKQNNLLAASLILGSGVTSYGIEKAMIKKKR